MLYWRGKRLLEKCNLRSTAKNKFKKHGSILWPLEYNMILCLKKVFDNIQKKNE